MFTVVAEAEELSLCEASCPVVETGFLLDVSVMASTHNEIGTKRS